MRSLLKLLVLALARFVPNQARVKLGAVKIEREESRVSTRSEKTSYLLCENHGRYLEQFSIVKSTKSLFSFLISCLRSVGI